jgi:phosphate transport system permease protein
MASGNASDRVFRLGALLFALTVVLITAALAVELVRSSWPALTHFGARFLTGSTWDPVSDVYGALPYIYGTIVSSAVALLVAVPIGLGSAVFLAELAPAWLRNPVSFLVELLAAVPSVVYGLWALFVLVPALRPVEVWLGAHFGSVYGHEIPLFSGAPYGVGLLAAGLILAIMILPIITAVSREVLLAVPRSQRDAAYALGATHWEALRGPILRYARAGVVGAVILGLGRALGETMAVTMVIGNSPVISASLFSPADTMSSLLANQFSESTKTLHVAALIEIALLLLLITVLMNAVARILLWRVATRGQALGVQE